MSASQPPPPPPPITPKELAQRPIVPAKNYDHSISRWVGILQSGYPASIARAGMEREKIPTEVINDIFAKVDKEPPQPLETQTENTESVGDFDPVGAEPGDINLSPGQWGRVLEISASGDVVFVKTEAGAYVLKGSASVAQEAFSTELCHALDIRAPRMRLIGGATAEYSELDACLRHPAVKAHTATRISVRRMLDRLVTIVMEYVPGTPLSAVPPHLASSIFALDQGGSTVLCGLGRVIAFDLLVNNYDRLPGVWANEGNAGNVLLARPNPPPDPAEVWAIDHGMVAIQLEDLKEQYLCKIREYLANTISLLSTPTGEIPKYNPKLPENKAEEARKQAAAENSESESPKIVKFQSPATKLNDSNLTTGQKRALEETRARFSNKGRSQRMQELEKKSLPIVVQQESFCGYPGLARYMQTVCMITLGREQLVCVAEGVVAMVQDVARRVDAEFLEGVKGKVSDMAPSEDSMWLEARVWWREQLQLVSVDFLLATAGTFRQALPRAPEGMIGARAEGV